VIERSGYGQFELNTNIMMGENSGGIPGTPYLFLDINMAHN